MLPPSQPQRGASLLLIIVFWNVFISLGYLSQTQWSFKQTVKPSPKLWLTPSQNVSSQSVQTREFNPARQVYSVAVVGSGAVGCYYGARLWEAGHSVKFLFRGKNYQTVQNEGLTVSSVDGDIFIPAGRELQVFSDTQQIGTVDWVLVALKSCSLEAIPDLVHPLLDPERTRLLVMMNGLVEEDLIRMMKEKYGQTVEDDAPLRCLKTLYGGMAFICSNRMGPAHVHHSYKGLLEAGIACSRETDLVKEKEAFLDLFRSSKVQTIFCETLLRGRWKKMMWNLPFNGISVAMGGITIDKVVGDPGLRELAYAVMDETIAVANAVLENRYGSGGFDPLGETEKELMMALSDGMGPYRTSTMLDLVSRRSMEVKYLFRIPVERAQKLNIPVPHLETLTYQIEALQRLHQLF